jgi:hypothetical protein
MKKKLTLEEKQINMQNRWEVTGQEQFKIAAEGWKLTNGERRVLNVLCSEGCTNVIRNGWPDFGVIVKGKLVGIEVKSEGDYLRDYQINTHKLLRKAGIDVIVVKGDEYLCSIQKQLRYKLSHP